MSFKIILVLSLLLGFFITFAAVYKFSLIVWIGKTDFFWIATGLSILGGVLMIFAQKKRLNLFKRDQDHDVFGPDVMMNSFLLSQYRLY